MKHIALMIFLALATGCAPIEQCGTRAIPPNSTHPTRVPHLFVHSDGRVTVDGSVVPSPDVPHHLRRAGIPLDADITLEGDGDVDMDLVVRLIKALGKAGFTHFQDQIGRSSAPMVATNIQHVVKEGEDLYAIAMMYAVPLAVLQATNHVAGVNLSAGQVLRVPVEVDAEKR